MTEVTRCMKSEEKQGENLSKLDVANGHVTMMPLHKNQSNFWSPDKFTAVFKNTIGPYDLTTYRRQWCKAMQQPQEQEKHCIVSETSTSSLPQSNLETAHVLFSSLSYPAYCQWSENCPYIKVTEPKVFKGDQLWTTKENVFLHYWTAR